MMYAIVDVNNFYVSCERIFRPDLKNTPIAVLSNNDGCIIARSEEVKNMGIKMGVPFFKVKQFCTNNGIKVFSSNYSLYGDISNRFIKTLEQYCENVEVYSIDEAFLRFDEKDEKEIVRKCENITKIIKQNIGIPISIGIGKTKTLAKSASWIAKKKLKQNVFILSKKEDIDIWLKEIPLGEIWNIGRGYLKKLNNIGIKTPHQLKTCEPNTMRDIFGINLLKTIKELNNFPCIITESNSIKKSITVSKTIGNPTDKFEVLENIISSYCSIACAKLRKNKLMAKNISIVIQSNRFQKDNFYKSGFGSTINYSNDTRLFIKVAKKILKSIYKKSTIYNKLGVTITQITESKFNQLDLIGSVDFPEQENSEIIMDLLDKVNSKIGKNKLFLASNGVKNKWKKKPINLSPKYTTRWQDIPNIKC